VTTTEQTRLGANKQKRPCRRSKGVPADCAANEAADAMTLMTDLIRQGQQAGEIRDRDAGGLAHLASVLTNEDALADVALARSEFHAVFDGAPRADQRDREQPQLAVCESSPDVPVRSLRLRRHTTGA
jgi:hypothetical protein